MKLRRALAAACVAAGLCLSGCQDSDEGALSVVVTLPKHYAAGAAKATVEVDYSGTGARILSEGGGAACAFILPGIDGDFVDDRKGTLTIHTNGARALRGSADIAACRMQASDAATTASDVHDKLLVKVAAAEDSAGKPIDLAAKEPKAQRGGGVASDSGGGAAMTESAIEEAQKAAVKAAASSVPPSVPNPSPGASDGPAAVSGALPRTSPASTAPAPAPAASSVTAQKQAAAAKAAAAPGILQNPAAASGSGRGAPEGNEGVVANPDKDPSYDDSPSDDATAPSYTLEFFVRSGGNFGALQLEINHLGNSGGFIGPQDQVECVSLVDAIVASNYVGERVLKVGLISLKGIRTPAAIMRCGFRTREPLSPLSFAVEVTDASDTESKAVNPYPAVVISTVIPR